MGHLEIRQVVMALMIGATDVPQKLLQYDAKLNNLLRLDAKFKKE